MAADKRLIEPRFKESIDAWIEDARPTGGFIQAVLRNDLLDAFARGDEAALSNLPHVIAYLYNDCPALCWGSPARVVNWTNAADAKALASELEDSAAAEREDDRDAKDRHDDARTGEARDDARGLNR